MREIRFRVWNTEEKKFVVFDKAHFEPLYHKLAAVENSGKHLFYEINDTTNFLTQWTGFVDKNKKPIFEGDIFFFDADILDTKYLYIKWFQEYGFYALTVKGDHYFLDLGTWADNKNADIKIFGNVFENINLLKVVKDFREIF